MFDVVQFKILIESSIAAFDPCLSQMNVQNLTNVRKLARLDQATNNPSNAGSGADAATFLKPAPRSAGCARG
jgi:hypothetical protein